MGKYGFGRTQLQKPATLEAMTVRGTSTLRPKTAERPSLPHTGRRHPGSRLPGKLYGMPTRTASPLEASPGNWGFLGTLYTGRHPPWPVQGPAGKGTPQTMDPNSSGLRFCAATEPTPMMHGGGHGSGLPPEQTGQEALKMIGRPGLEVAHRVSTALTSSVLMGAWPPTPSCK